MIERCLRCSGPDSPDRRDTALDPTRVSLNAINQSREPVSASVTRPVHRARCQSAANRSIDANLACDALKILRMAECPGGGAPRDDDPLAPCGMATVLAPEVSTQPTGDSPTIAGSDPVSYTHLRAHETRHDLVCRL